MSGVSADGARLLLERERDLYLGLLNLSGLEDPARFMEQALSLIVEVSGAQRGYLELSDPDAPGDAEDASTWWTAAGCSDEEVAEIRANVSRGIIAHAVAQGQLMNVPSALLDPRFRERASVKRSQIEAVLCAPIGGDPPRGVVYLQGRGSAGPFPDDDVARAQAFSMHLVPLAQRLFERYRQRTEDATRDFRSRLNLDGLVGSSEALGRVLKEVELAAPLDVSLVITGDTGTGKSQLARVIHNNSPRRAGPFVEINCAAIPESLMESELFGAEAGAHSTATKRVEGKVAAASGGTLFLDEVAELSMTAQAKLLQLLQTKQYYPLGAARPLTADLRVIAATNSDLKQRIDSQTFREDLYYRLQVLPLRVPSLAERRTDIAELAAHFCKHAQRSHSLRGVELSPGARRALTARQWPGNVRELGHVVEAGTIRAAAEGAEYVEAAHLFPGAAKDSVQPTEGLSFQEATRRFQLGLLQEILSKNDWNIAATARELDLTRAHVYNLIKAFGLARDQSG